MRNYAYTHRVSSPPNTAADMPHTTHQHTASTAATPRYPQGRRQTPSVSFSLLRTRVEALVEDQAVAKTIPPQTQTLRIHCFKYTFTTMREHAVAFWPLHDIAITNMVYGVCMAHTSKGGRGFCILRNSRAILLQWCGQCKWGWAIIE